MKRQLLLLIMICILLCFSGKAFALDIPAIYGKGVVVWTQDGYIYAIGTVSILDHNFKQIASRDAGQRIALAFSRSDEELINTILALSDKSLIIKQGVCYVLVRFPLEILGKTDFKKRNPN